MSESPSRNPLWRFISTDSQREGRTDRKNKFVYPIGSKQVFLFHTHFKQIFLLTCFLMHMFRSGEIVRRWRIKTRVWLKRSNFGRWVDTYRANELTLSSTHVGRCWVTARLAKKIQK